MQARHFTYNNMYTHTCSGRHKHTYSQISQQNPNNEHQQSSTQETDMQQHHHHETPLLHVSLWVRVLQKQKSFSLSSSFHFFFVKNNFTHSLLESFSVSLAKLKWIFSHQLTTHIKWLQNFIRSAQFGPEIHHDGFSSVSIWSRSRDKNKAFFKWPPSQNFFLRWSKTNWRKKKKMWRK